MSALAEILGSGAATVCRAWVIARRDGLVLGFTDHDGTLLVDGVTCMAGSGMSAGALQAGTGLAVDNAEASGALNHDAISAEDIRAGTWDAAGVTSYLVDWSEPSRFEILFRGSLGEITWGDDAFSAELRGQAETLNQTRGRVYQGQCDANLGDHRCQIDFGTRYSVEGEIVASTNGLGVTVAALPAFSPGMFERGRIIVLDGRASGQSERIKTDRGDTVARHLTFWKSLRRVPAPGDRVRLEAGCDKRKETCQAKFDNLKNFRGFPDIPGDDWLMAYPRRDGQNDGGRS